MALEYERIPKVLAKLETRHPSENRYKDVVPYQHNAVKVGSTYINASFINSMFYPTCAEATAYIATQAPLPSTIETFWEMIDQYEVPAIFMLTKIVEKDRIKAYPYWGEADETIEFTNLNVTLVQCYKYNYADLTKTVFRVDNKRTGTSRMVNHYMYTGWPDFGVPRDHSVLRKLLDLMDRYYDANFSREPSRTRVKGCQVIHCSAGVGRTGVLLALHIQREARRMGITTNFKQIVTSLRTQRPMMVNTLVQYQFLHSFKLFDDSRTYDLPTVDSTCSDLFNDTYHKTYHDTFRSLKQLSLST